MASEAVVIAREPLVSIGTVKDALDFCDEQMGKPDLSEEMQKATQFIRAMSRAYQLRDLLRLE